MELGSLLILLLLLACPLLMFGMMRGHGGHGGHASHGAGHGHHADEMSGAGSLDELRRRREELDVEIAEREQVETAAETTTSASV